MKKATVLLAALLALGLMALWVGQARADFFDYNLVGTPTSNTGASVTVLDEGGGHGVIQVWYDLPSFSTSDTFTIVFNVTPIPASGPTAHYPVTATTGLRGSGGLVLVSVSPGITSDLDVNETSENITVVLSPDHNSSGAEELTAHIKSEAPRGSGVGEGPGILVHVVATGGCSGECAYTVTSGLYQGPNSPSPVGTSGVATVAGTCSSSTDGAASVLCRKSEAAPDDPNIQLWIVTFKNIGTKTLKNLTLTLDESKPDGTLWYEIKPEHGKDLRVWTGTTGDPSALRWGARTPILNTSVGSGGFPVTIGYTGSEATKTLTQFNSVAPGTWFVVELRIAKINGKLDGSGTQKIVNFTANATTQHSDDCPAQSAEAKVVLTMTQSSNP